MAPDKKRVSSGGQGSSGVSRITDRMGNTSLEDGPEKKELTSREVAALVGKRVDLPPNAYFTSGTVPESMKRPERSNDIVGNIKIALNVFQVTTLPNPKNKIYQYSISAQPNHKESKTLAKRLWGTKTVQTWLEDHSDEKNTARWIYDGQAMAWSLDSIKDKCDRIAVTLPKNGNAPRGNSGTAAQASSTFYLTIEETAEFTLKDLDNHLRGNAEWNNSMIMQLSFLDHVLRQGPSNRLTAIKRCFYSSDLSNYETTRKLGPHTRAIAGAYAAFRPLNGIPGIRLGVNIDVSHTAFWLETPTLCDVARDMIKSNFSKIEKDHEIITRLKPVKKENKYIMSDVFQFLRRLEKTKFVIRHVKTATDKIYTIDSFLFDTKEFPGGADSTNAYFYKKNDNGSKTKTTVFDHFRSIGKTLKYPKLPVIKTPKGAYFPLEVCFLAPMQRYPFKLSPDDTSKMIKFAVSFPETRRNQIKDKVTTLSWKNDPHLKAFGIAVDENMLVTAGRLLTPPNLHFDKSLPLPPSHRWNLDGVRFADVVCLKSWIAVNFDPEKETRFTKFLEAFRGKYKTHVDSKPVDPITMAVNLKTLNKGGFIEGCRFLLEKAKTRFGCDAQIVFFFLPKRDTATYELIKNVMDCHFKLPSQIVLFEKIEDPRLNMGQYCSNISLKINAKLGGVNCRAKPAKQAKALDTNKRTMFIGLDVSHAPAGTNQASMAALTVSIDPDAVRYGAACQTNGIRTELVKKKTIKDFLPRFIMQWRVAHKTPDSVKDGGPEHLYFFRDGLDAGQFQAVIDEEVAAIRETFADASLARPAITVVIVTKRHHVRVFTASPGQRSVGFDNKNSNPKPGLLVEQGATHPEYWDFFLNSHVAIQGTSRPIHYQVILNETKCQPNELQQTIFNHCYQFCRATLPVSQHPAVYYAHLASKRAQAHLRPVDPDKTDDGPPDLLAMRDGQLKGAQSSAIEKTMWFV